MNSITLSVRNGQYVARFEGPHSYPVIGALGSPDLPLAFAANTPLGEVAEPIRDRLSFRPCALNLFNILSELPRSGV